MSKRSFGVIAANLGAVLLLASLAANPLGIGTNPNEFGWLQTLGAFLGCLALASGLWLARPTK